MYPFDSTKCVIHLIKYKKLSYDSDDSDNDNDNATADAINDFITDQYIDLWKMMKKGDLIEDINQSGYRAQGRYYVDDDPKRKKSILKNGLIIRDLYTELDDYGSIPPHFFTITEFPIGYFDEDKIIVNNKFCPKIKKESYWHSDVQPCFIDCKRLKLDKLTDDNIFVDYTDDNTNDNMYTYIILRFKKSNFCLINIAHKGKDKINWMISIFKKDYSILEQSFYDLDDSIIKKISKEHNVDLSNFLTFD
jgi:hypothetical protein